MDANSINDLAKLASLDTGEIVFMEVQQGTQHFGAHWEEAGVRSASPQPLEFRGTTPEERTIQFALKNINTDKIRLSVEEQIALLKKFSRRMQGKGRPHNLLFTYRGRSFRCELKSCHLVNDQSGTLVLKEAAR